MIDWFKKLWNRVTAPRKAPTQDLRPSLVGERPGAWASNHYEEAMHCSGWTFCAVRAIAQQVSQASLKVFNGEVELKRGQIPKGLIRPNPAWAMPTYLFAMAQQMSLTGTAHQWLIRNYEGQILEQYILPTGITTPLPPSAEYPYGSYKVIPQAGWVGWGESGYMPPGILSMAMGAGMIVDARDVKSTRWPHPVYPFDALSPLQAGAVQIDVSEQVDRARWYGLRNGMNPDLLFKLTTQTYPTQDEREAFREDLRRRHGGTPNNRSPMLLPPGVEPTNMNKTPAELDCTAGWAQSRDAVLALHGTPAVAIGIMDAGSYAAFYASLQQFTDLTIQPLLNLIAEDLSELYAPYIVTLTAKALNDPQLEMQRWQMDLSSGCITVNEYRARRGLPPVPGGDVLLREQQQQQPAPPEQTKTELQGRPLDSEAEKDMPRRDNK